MNDQETLAWFGDAATHLRSMTQVPLRAGNGVCCGLLVMASDDPRRFYPELGTLYLERIGSPGALRVPAVLNADPAAVEALRARVLEAQRHDRARELLLVHPEP